jgi:hypothetical protein
MGGVHRAHDSRLKWDVAIKVPPEAVAADGDRLARYPEGAAPRQVSLILNWFEKLRRLAPASGRVPTSCHSSRAENHRDPYRQVLTMLAIQLRKAGYLVDRQLDVATLYGVDRFRPRLSGLPGGRFCEIPYRQDGKAGPPVSP